MERLREMGTLSFVMNMRESIKDVECVASLDLESTVFAHENTQVLMPILLNG